MCATGPEFNDLIGTASVRCVGDDDSAHDDAVRAASDTPCHPALAPMDDREIRRLLQERDELR